MNTFRVKFNAFKIFLIINYLIVDVYLKHFTPNNRVHEFVCWTLKVFGKFHDVTDNSIYSVFWIGQFEIRCS